MLSKTLKMKPSITQTLKAALTSGVIALVLNQIWNFIALNYLNAMAPAGPWIILVGTSSVIPLLLAGVVYFLLEKYTSKGSLIFIITALILTVFSIYPNLQTTLPDGTAAPQNFALLSIPMHFIAGLAAAFGIPHFSK